MVLGLEGILVRKSWGARDSSHGGTHNTRQESEKAPIRDPHLPLQP